MPKQITNVDIFDRLERLRLELSKQIESTSRDHKSELADLRRQFETLEAGRLTRLEGRMNDFVVSQANRDAGLKENQAVMSTKFLVIWSLAGAIMVATLTAAAYRVIVGGTPR
jgi:hypothetical protein